MPIGIAKRAELTRAPRIAVERRNHVGIPLSIFGHLTSRSDKAIGAREDILHHDIIQVSRTTPLLTNAEDSHFNKGPGLSSKRRLAELAEFG